MNDFFTFILIYLRLFICAESAETMATAVSLNTCINCICIYKRVVITLVYEHLVYLIYLIIDFRY
jgi:hypothetical protein